MSAGSTSATRPCGCWWNRFGPMFAAEIRRRRVDRMRGFRQWRWHLDEMYVKINGEMHYLWRAVDHEGEVLESFVTKTRDRKAALKFLKKSMRRHGRPESIVTDRLRSYGAALKDLGRGDDRDMGRWVNNRGEFSPALPATRTGDVEVPPDAEPSEIRLDPRLRQQSLQPGANALKPRTIQS